MDVWGVEGVRAETELLAAMVSFFEKMGLTSDDVGIKINSRGVVAEVLAELGVEEDKFASVCVLIDKLEKVPLDAIQSDLEALGLTTDTIEKVTTILSSKSLEALATYLPPTSPALQELETLLSLAESYNISPWIQFDASVIRGLAYYTGIVFEAFDRKGQLRAIAGGGRYDKLLETFGGDATPAVGFGFGDAVIVELLKDRDLLPDFTATEIEVVVFAMRPELYDTAVSVASRLRGLGKRVDVVLEDKKTKWVFKHADRLQANYVIIVAPDEVERGEVSVKDLKEGSQTCLKLEDLEKEFLELN